MKRMAPGGGVAVEAPPEILGAPQMLHGREAILAMLPQLRQLAEKSGQPGFADTIDYFLTQPYTGGKSPHLLLFHRDRVLQGVVLVHQYRLAGVPLGIYVTEDTGGERNVLAPAGVRSLIAQRAAEELLRDRGAHLVMLSLQGADFSPGDNAAPARERWASGRRTLLRRMRLLRSYDATLETLGAHTRRNFRLYRRRALAAHACVFVPWAELSEAEFVALNGRCDYPVPLRVAQWRYRSVHTVPGGVLAGVRAGDGTWISMVGGRRSHGTFTVDWQMNNSAFARISPATVLRGYLMEHESTLGTSELLFQGGTPHSMQSAFRPEPVMDLIGVSGTLPSRLLLRIMKRVRQPGNLLLQTLADPGLTWHGPR